MVIDKTLEMATTISESMDDMVIVPNIPSDTADPDTATNVPPTPLDESEFDRSKMATLGNKVRLTDSDEAHGLELYCYVHCGPTDNELLHQCRGVVFDKEKLVMRAFPYTVEWSEGEVDQVKDSLDPIFNDSRFYDSHEGALIRMFHYNGKWFTSTHRKLSAFSSKWGSKESFGSSFKRALEYEITRNPALQKAIPQGDENLLERFQSTLDTNKQYMFLVRHCQEHRIVCNYPENPTMYHVGTFVEGKLVMTECCNIPHPKEHKFSSQEELLEHVSRVDIRNLQGVICFSPQNKQVKVVNREYQELFRARGNEPSIKFRYLQMRLNQRVNDMLCRLYPDMVQTFDEVENNIYEIAKNIYTAYVQRFIKKRFVTVPTEEFAVVKECHKWHEEDRITHRISINKVIGVLNQQSPTNINRMIRRYRTEKLEQTKQQKINHEQTKAGTVENTPTASPMVFEKPDGKVVSPLQLAQKSIMNNVPPMKLAVDMTSHPDGVEV